MWIFPGFSRRNITNNITWGKRISVQVGGLLAKNIAGVLEFLSHTPEKKGEEMRLREVEEGIARKERDVNDVRNQVNKAVSRAVLTTLGGC